MVTTFAGTGAEGSIDGANPTFDYPFGVTTPNSNGDIFVSDYNSNKIRQINSTGFTTTLAGNGTSSSINGAKDKATFNGPLGIVFDSGSVFVTEEFSFLVRRVTGAGLVSTFVTLESQGGWLGVDNASNIYAGDYDYHRGTCKSSFVKQNFKVTPEYLSAQSFSFWRNYFACW